MPEGLLSPIALIASYLERRGVVAVGSKLYVYAAGSTSLAPTWSDAGLTRMNPNPMVIITEASSASFQAWAPSTARFKLIFTDTKDIPIPGAVLDNVPLLDDVAKPISSRTAAEIKANVVPTNYNHPELNILRYGAAADSKDAAASILTAVAVAVAYGNGEIVVPKNHVFEVSQVVLEKLSGFRIRCDGTLKSNAPVFGPAFTDQRPVHQGRVSPLKIIGCTGFKIYGSGQINNGRVESIYMVSCSNFDLSLDLKGNGTNSNLPGVWIQSCSQFILHDMIWDSLTAQSMNDTAEVYHPWLNQAQIQQCDHFKISKLTSRRSGMNGIYIGSDCHDFEISDSTFEYSAGSGIQIAYQGFGSTPSRYKIANNRVRYNQADGIDANNTSGNTVSIFAEFKGNQLFHNGWINCNPLNGAGSDGSGIGTYIFVADFEVAGNIAYECASWGTYVDNCRNYRITGNTIIKTSAGSLNGGVYVSGLGNGYLEGNDVVVAGTKQALLMSPCKGVKFLRNSLSGLVTINNGEYPGCSMTACRLNAGKQVAIPFDMIDCDVAVTNAGQNGLYVTHDSVKLQGNTVSAPNHAIVVSSVNRCKLIDNVATSTGRGNGILVASSTGTVLRKNTVKAISGHGIFVTGGCVHTEISDNRASSMSGNSFRVDSTNSHSLIERNVTMVGVESFLGTYDGVQSGR